MNTYYLGGFGTNYISFKNAEIFKKNTTRGECFVNKNEESSLK